MRLALALGLIASVILAGCGSSGAPKVESLVRTLNHDGPRAAAIDLSKKDHELKEIAEEYGVLGQEWLCFAAETSTYDSKTGQITTPTKTQIQEKAASLPLPRPRYKPDLDRFYKTLQAVSSNELAKDAIDVGCTAS